MSNIPAEPPVTDPEELLAVYRRKLARHDWFYQHADCHKTYSKGRVGYNLLCGLQQQLDKDFAIWNSICPAEFVVQQPVSVKTPS